MTTASPALRHESLAPSYTWLLVGAGLLTFAVSAGVALAIGEMQALWVALSLVTCVAVLFDFRVGAAALILMLPVSATSLFPHELMGLQGLNPINLLLAGTMFSFLMRGWQQRTGPLVPQPLIWLYVVPIVIAGVIGSFHADEIVPFFYENESVNFTGPIGYLRDLLAKPLIIVAVAVMVGAAAARSQKPERFIIPIALSVWLVTLVEIGYVVLSGVRIGDLAGRTARTFFATVGLHANDLGRLLAVAYALLLFCWWETKNAALKTFLFFTMGALALGLLMTFSRGAFIGFLLVNAMFVAWKFNARTLALALTVGALAALFMPGYVVGRFTMGFDSDWNAVSAGRIEEIWLPLMPEVLGAPLWGNGLSSVMWSYAMETGAMLNVLHPHNAYLEAWLDMGLLGLGLLVAYYVHVWRGFRALGSNAYLSPELRGFFQGAAAGLLCFAVTGLVGSSLRPVWEFAYLWMAIGMMYGIAARRPTS